MRAFVLLLLLCFSPSVFAVEKGLPFFDSKELTPYWPTDEQANRFAPATVGSFHVVDQNGAKTDETAFQGRISLVSFFFAQCPKICPLMMRSIQRFQGKLGARKSGVRIYSFSVKPEHDSPSVLRDYAKAHGIDLRDWTLLTGKREEVYRIGREVFKADGAVGQQKSESSFIHTQNVYLVDQQRRIRGIYDTSDTQAMDLLIQDIRRLQIPPSS